LASKNKFLNNKVIRIAGRKRKVSFDVSFGLLNADVRFSLLTNNVPERGASAILS